MTENIAFPIPMEEKIRKGKKEIKDDTRKDKCQPKIFVTIEYRVTSLYDLGQHPLRLQENTW